MLFPIRIWTLTTNRLFPSEKNDKHQLSKNVVCIVKKSPHKIYFSNERRKRYLIWFQRSICRLSRYFNIPFSFPKMDSSKMWFSFVSLEFRGYNRFHVQRARSIETEVNETFRLGANVTICIMLIYVPQSIHIKRYRWKWCEWIQSERVAQTFHI